MLVEYGVPIQRAAMDAQESVRKAIESMTGLHVVRVDVHVQSVSFEKENNALQAGAASAALEAGDKTEDIQPAADPVPEVSPAAPAAEPGPQAAAVPAEEPAAEQQAPKAAAPAARKKAPRNRKPASSVKETLPDDAAETAGSIGIRAENSVDYHADCCGTNVLYEAVGCAVSSMRAKKSVDSSWKCSVEADNERRANTGSGNENKVKKGGLFGIFK